MVIKNTIHNSRDIPRLRSGQAVHDKFGKIGVLMGGASSEREISLKSGEAVYMALKQRNLQALPIDIKSDNVEENISLLKSFGINCAFVALHGRFGEDGQIQGILEALGLPYTGSGVSASRLAMDKIASRQLFERGGLKVPKYFTLDTSLYQEFRRGTKFHNLDMPLVVKPAAHGSSIGLSICYKEEDLGGAIESAFTFDKEIIIEEYIRGREITVGILDGQALPVIEIIPKKIFFDYEAKYKSGMTDYIVPAELEESITKKAKEAALAAHRLLGCFGFSRVDMILSNECAPVVLELNTIPGLTAMSLLPKAARIVGIDFGELCFRLVKLAYEKAKV